MGCHRLFPTLILIALLALAGCRTMQPTDQEQASPTTVEQTVFVIAYPEATLTIKIGDGSSGLEVDASGDVAGEAAAKQGASPQVDVSAEATAPINVNPTGGAPPEREENP